MKKRKKKNASKYQRQTASNETYTAFNTRLFLIIAMFLLFVFIAYTCFIEREIGIGIGFSIASLLPVFVFIISPLYMVFSHKEIKIVYVLGQIETIQRTDIRNIMSFGGFCSEYEPLPYYEISYPKSKKQPFFVDGEIPKTFKVKRLMKKYYKDKLL